MRREQKEKTHEKQVNFMFEPKQEDQFSRAERARQGVVDEVEDRGRVQIMYGHVGKEASLSLRKN